MTDIFNLDISPFIIIHGKSRSGKSYFLKQIIPKQFKKKFHLVKYINPSFFSMDKKEQEDYKKWFGSHNIFTDSKKVENPEFFDNLISELEQWKIKNPKKKCLLLIDDLGFLFSKLKRQDGDFLDKIASRFRHIGTCCILIQDILQVSNFVRKNTTHIVLTKTLNTDVIEALYKSFNCGLDKKEFFKLFKDTFQNDKKYIKLFINNYETKIKVIK